MGTLILLSFGITRIIYKPGNILVGRVSKIGHVLTVSEIYLRSSVARCFSIFFPQFGESHAASTWAWVLISLQVEKRLFRGYQQPRKIQEKPINHH